jgi:hypothetical protein
VFVVCFVGSGLCDGLIIRAEDSYRARVCLTACDLVTSKLRWSRPIWAVALQEMSNDMGFRRSVDNTQLV